MTRAAACRPVRAGSKVQPSRGIAAAARFLLRHQPSDGARLDLAEDQLSRDQREDDRDGYGKRTPVGAAKRPARGRSQNKSHTPPAANTRRADDSISTSHERGRNQDGNKCLSSQRCVAKRRRAETGSDESDGRFGGDARA